MKNNYFKKYIPFILLAGFLFAASSCGKSKVGPAKNKSLYGSWIESPAALSNTERIIYFNQDGSFTMSFVTFGTGASSISLSGTYKVKADSLLIAIKSQTIREGNKPEVVTPSHIPLFDKAIFFLDDRELSLRYTSYPADAPVPTQTDFKMLTIAQ